MIWNMFIYKLSVDINGCSCKILLDQLHFISNIVSTTAVIATTKEGGYH